MSMVGDVVDVGPVPDGGHQVEQAECLRLGGYRLLVRHLHDPRPVGQHGKRRLDRAEYVLHAVGALERFRRRGETLAREHRGEHRRAHRERRRAALHHRQLPPPADAQRQVDGDRQRGRVGQLSCVEAEELPDRERHRGRHERALVEAEVADGNLGAEAAEQFVGQCHRGQHLDACGPGDLADGQDAGHHVAGVAAAAGLHAVIPVVRADHDGVGERREFGCGQKIETDHGGAVDGTDGTGQPPGHLGGLGVTPGDRDGHRVHQMIEGGRQHLVGELTGVE